MPKYKALQTFASESLGLINEGDIKEITVAKADQINKHAEFHYNTGLLERVEEPKKAGKK